MCHTACQRNRFSNNVYETIFHAFNPQSTQLIWNIFLFLLFFYYWPQFTSLGLKEQKIQWSIKQKRTQTYSGYIFLIVSLIFGHIIIFIVHFVNDFQLSYPYSHHHRIRDTCQAALSSPHFQKLLVYKFLFNKHHNDRRKQIGKYTDPNNQWKEKRNKRKTHRGEENLFINKLNFTLRGKIIANKYSEKVLKFFRYYLRFFCFCHLHQCVLPKSIDGKIFFSNSQRKTFFLYVSGFQLRENEVIIIWRRVLTVKCQIMEIFLLFILDENVRPNCYKLISVSVVKEKNVYRTWVE